MELFADVNYLAVIIAGLVSFAVGALWYSPVMFSGRWQKALGFTDDYLAQANMVKVFGSSLVLMIVMALGVNLILLEIYGTEFGLYEGAKTGAALAGFFGVTSIGINYLYQRRGITLWLIDASYQLLFMALAGAIIGLMA